MISSCLFAKPPTILRATRLQTAAVPETNVRVERLHYDLTQRPVYVPLSSSTSITVLNDYKQ